MPSITAARPKSSIKESKKASTASDSSATKGPSESGGFIVGDRVRYWSASQSKWIGAHVQRVNYGIGGKIISYDLTAKAQADAAKVRAFSTPEDSPPPAPAPRVPWPSADAPGGLAAGRLEGGGAPPKCFKPGDRVQYWSASKVRWVEARVESRQEDKGGIVMYDLNCKKGTPASQLRAQPLQYVVGEKVEYWSSGIGQWVAAKVMKLNVELGQCDLDIKFGAKMGRMRKIAGAEELHSFKVGDRVQYSSDSKGRWLEAIVEGIRTKQGAVLYDLNCKKGTLGHRLRHSPSGGAALPYKPGDRVEYWSASARRWLPAKILRLAAHLGQCDLDVKQSAALGRLRRAAGARGRPAVEAALPPPSKRRRAGSSPGQEAETPPAAVRDVAPVQTETAKRRRLDDTEAGPPPPPPPRVCLRPRVPSPHF